MGREITARTGTGERDERKGGFLSPVRLVEAGTTADDCSKLPEACPIQLASPTGVVSGSYFLDSTDEKNELTFAVNTLAHLWMAKVGARGVET